jgi:flagellar biosynthesis protein FlhG
MQNKLPLVISVTSGKGGVGKTNISVNLSYCLQKLGNRVLILDADLGLANVDVLLGLTPEHNIFHLLNEGLPLSKILVQTKYGFLILPATSGVTEMLSLSSGQKLELLEAMDYLEDRIDFLIVDTGAGLGDNVIYFNLAVCLRMIKRGEFLLFRRG